MYYCRNYKIKHQLLCIDDVPSPVAAYRNCNAMLRPRPRYLVLKCSGYTSLTFHFKVAADALTSSARQLHSSISLLQNPDNYLAHLKFDLSILSHLQAILMTVIQFATESNLARSIITTFIELCDSFDLHRQLRTHRGSSCH